MLIFREQFLQKERSSTLHASYFWNEIKQLVAKIPDVLKNRDGRILKENLEYENVTEFSF